MSRAWRIVAFFAAALIGLGLVLMGAGWLTGASLPRMESMVFGSRAAAREAYQGILRQAVGLPEQIKAFVSEYI